MGLEYCEACKREVTPKFKWSEFFLFFFIIPAIVYWLLSTTVSFILYGVTLLAAVSGAYRVCPICNTQIYPKSYPFRSENFSKIAKYVTSVSDKLKKPMSRPSFLRVGIMLTLAGVIVWLLGPSLSLSTNLGLMLALTISFWLIQGYLSTQAEQKKKQKLNNE